MTTTMLDVQVRDVVPLIALSGANLVRQGAVYTLTLGAVTDPGTDSVARYIVDWADGSQDEYTAAGNVTHVFANTLDDHVIQVLLVDEDGTHAGGEHNLFVNASPTANFANSGAADEAGSATVSFTNATDANVTDVVAGFLYRYDFDNDGTFELSGSAASAVVPASLLRDGPGSLTVRGRIEDQHGGFTDYTTVIGINNVAPTPFIDSISNPRREGTAITVVGATTDPAGLLDTLTFTWIVYKGTTPFASATGVNRTNFQFTPDNNGSYRIVLNVRDEDGDSNSVEQSIDVSNVAPTLTDVVSANSDCLNSSANRSVTVCGAFIDPGTSDTHSVSVNWGDGTVENVTVNQTADTFAGSHIYNSGGMFSIVVTAIDHDGSSSAPVATSAMAQGVGVVNGTLYIIGTEGRDHVQLKFKPKQDELTVDAKLNQGGGGGNNDRIKQTFAASAIDRIISHLCGDDDHYDGGSDGGSDGDADFAIPQFIFGGTGDDHLLGSQGSNVIVGGAGNDKLEGGHGRDILIGGSGKDDLHGGIGDDLLIGGSTVDDSLSALDIVFQEWISPRSYQERIGRLKMGVNGVGLNDSNLFDDGNKDTLQGGSELDWFIGGIGDKISDKKSNETAEI